MCVTQNELAFLNRIAVCDVGNHLRLLWRCTDTSLQPSALVVTVHWHVSPAICACCDGALTRLCSLTKYALPCAIIFLVSYIVYTLISCVSYLKMLGAVQNREIVYWHTVFDTISHRVSSSWHLEGCSIFVFKDQAVFLYFLNFEDESTIFLQMAGAPHPAAQCHLSDKSQHCCENVKSLLLSMDAAGLF